MFGQTEFFEAFDLNDAVKILESTLYSVIRRRGLNGLKLSVSPVSNPKGYSIKFKDCLIARIRKGARVQRLEFPQPNGRSQDKIKNQEEIEKIPLGRLEDVELYAGKAGEICAAIIDSWPTDFHCCSRYEECSNARSCTHPDKDAAIGCYYRKVLVAGKIFYGKNRNIDDSGAVAEDDYKKYTKPAELHKAVNMLNGIISGIDADGTANSAEMAELVNWCSLHENLRNRPPFNELLPIIDRVVQSEVIDIDDKQEILFICREFTSDAKYYDIKTALQQTLNGILHGTLSDGVLSDKEILYLNSWMDESDFLTGTYPYDEIRDIIKQVLADSVITEEERGRLMAVMGNAIEFKNSYNLCEADFKSLRKKYSIEGVCADNPVIEFVGKSFCFTGESYSRTRDELSMLVEAKGAIVKKSVTKKLDYLVVCGRGNQCWAYDAYGRKVEAAIDLRRDGANIVILNEEDFMKAINNA